jgi:hypothetical protein
VDSPYVESKSFVDVLALATVAVFVAYFYLKFQQTLTGFIWSAFIETGLNHVSLSKTSLIFPFADHVVLAIFSAALLTLVGLLMDFFIPVPQDLLKKAGDKPIYNQKVIRGVVGVIFFLLEGYEVVYLGRLQIDIVWAKSPLAEFLNAFAAGFFIYEMIGLTHVYVDFLAILFVSNSSIGI